LASFKTPLNFEPPAFKNAARYLKSETKVKCRDDRSMIWSSLVKLSPCTPRKLCQLRKRAKSSITQPWIIRFAHILYSIYTHDTRSAVKVQGQEVKCQDHSVTTYQHQKRHNSGTYKLSKVKLGENYPRAELCM